MGHPLPEDEGRDDNGHRICKKMNSVFCITEYFQGVGLIGAFVSIVLGNGKDRRKECRSLFSFSGFESFLYWSSFFISGTFLFTHITSLTQVLETKVPALAKIVR